MPPCKAPQTPNGSTTPRGACRAGRRPRERGCRSRMSVENPRRAGSPPAQARSQALASSPSSRKSSSPTGTSPSPRPPASTTPRTAFPSLPSPRRTCGGRSSTPSAAAPGATGCPRASTPTSWASRRLRPWRAGRDRLRADRPEPSPDDTVEQMERLRVLATIPERERIALIRTIVDGEAAAEVADEFGVSPNRVYQLVQHGSARLEETGGMTSLTRSSRESLSLSGRRRSSRVVAEGETASRPAGSTSPRRR